MAIPKSIDGYPIVKVLGEGGMGIVYQALDPTMKDRAVALKTIKITDPAKDEIWLERFKSEAQVVGHLNHRHIVTVHKVNLEHNPPYMVMELLQGGTLRDHLKQSGPLPWPNALMLLQPMLYALEYAHEVGIIHRDIKPENMMFDLQRVRRGTQDKVLKLTDFGLARDLRADRFTVAGSLLGTVAYMSPEQANGEDVDAKTDLFALGVILFEAIMGYNPLRKDNFLTTLDAARSGERLNLTALKERVPANVFELIEQATAKDRYLRYPTAEEMLKDWLKCMGDIPTQPPSDGPPPPDFNRVFAAENDMGAYVAENDAEPQDEPNADDHEDCLDKITLGHGVTLPPKGEQILCLLFPDATAIFVEKEFQTGFLSRVYQVLCTDTKKNVRTYVVKMAPKRLIEQEYNAYKNCIKNRLVDVADIVAGPVAPQDSLWDGLCYLPAGMGVFKTMTLKEFFEEATLDQLLHIFEDVLFKILGQTPLGAKAAPGFMIRNSYDRVLPVNLYIRPASSIDGPKPTEISKLKLPSRLFELGEYVKLSKFRVTKVDVAKREITLNLPPPKNHKPEDGPWASYQVRLVEVQNPTDFKVDQIQDITGVVTATRADFLKKRIPNQEQLDLSSPELSIGDAKVKNPILYMETLLSAALFAKMACIHGDLHLENIIYVVEPGNIKIIDFADARHDHVLHDLFRLETSVMTWLLPAKLRQLNKCTPEMIYEFYRQVDFAVRFFYREDIGHPPHPDLEKLFKVVVAIRRAASKYNFIAETDNWQEYYHGLAIYLTGALKFGNFDKDEDARWVAFWAAATACQFHEKLPDIVDDPEVIDDLDDDEEEKDEEGGKFPEWIKYAVASSIVAVILGIVIWYFWPSPTPISLTTIITTTDGSDLQDSPQITLMVEGEESRSPDEVNEAKATFSLPADWNDLEAILFVESSVHYPYTHTIVLQQSAEVVVPLEPITKTIVITHSPPITGMVEFADSPSITYTFYIDRQEVIIANYEDCQQCPTIPTEGEEDDPMVNINWTEAQSYCELQGKTLPTLAEWKYASASLTQSQALTDAIKSPDGPQKGCSNELDITPAGVCDMAGNVQEWVLTPAHNKTNFYLVAGDYYGNSPIINVRTGKEGNLENTDSNIAVGFRCAYRVYN